MNQFTKNCPVCGREQKYSCKSSLTASIKKNKKCLKCTQDSIRTHQVDVLEKMCSCGNMQKYSTRKVFNRAVSGNWKCKKCATKESAKSIDRSYQKTEEFREKMSQSIKSSERNKNKFTDEVREKLRIAKLNQIRKLGTKYTYNPKACKFIDEFGKKNGYNFQHAMNGGEIMISGYSLDGYDKIKNIVFEYDEPKHTSPSMIQKDLIRQNRIINKISPIMFVRYDEVNNVLCDVISKQEVL